MNSVQTSAHELKRLKVQRGITRCTLTKINNYLKDFNEDKRQFETRTHQLANLLETFMSIQIEIMIFEKDDTNDDDDGVSVEIQEFEDKYYETMKMYNDILSNFPDTTTSATTSTVNQAHTSDIRLPAINLPTFDGKYEEWLNFSEIFKSLIHNNATLTPVRKFHYLISSLKGDAADEVKSLEINADNYETAWQLLKKRFENTRIIVQKHLAELFAIKPIQRESAKELRKLFSSFSQHLKSLKALGRPTDSWDDVIVHVLSNKFDPDTRKDWENTIKEKKSTELPTYKEIEEFLLQRCQYLESIGMPPYKETEKRTVRQSMTAIATKVKTLKCVFCNDDHFATQCSKFKDLSVKERIESVKKIGCCLNCLRKGHKMSECNSTTNCRTCNKRHHSLLHVTPEQSENPANVRTTDSAVSNICYNPSSILLATAIVEILDVWGNRHPIRVLLDSGSQVNLITTRLAHSLALEITRLNLPVRGIGSSQIDVTSCTKTTIHSRHTEFSAILMCLMIDTLSERTPNSILDKSTMCIPNNLSLADPDFNLPSNIDMLIGAELFYKVLCIGQINLGSNCPTLQKTKFGWIVSGMSGPANATSQISQCHLTNVQLNNSLQKMWAIEDVPSTKCLSVEDQRCESEFTSNITRDPTGRFVVKLIRQENAPALGESFTNALRRLESIERKFERDNEFKKEYVNFMREYEALNHMRPVTAQDEHDGYFLPHHGVLKESSTTTKLRVVFDASAKTSNGYSLNDTLAVGPSVQDDLFTILTRFRTYPYVLCADIEKMYRQVLIAESDKASQRILWREDKKTPLKIFELQTVTYGTSCASYLATRCLKFLSDECTNQLPDAAMAIAKDFYVDDLLTGAETIEQARKLKCEITQILQSAGFKLHKWLTNDDTILTERQESSTSTSMYRPHSDEENSQRTLGIGWIPTSDEIKYEAPNIDNRKICKRSIISAISRIFDPLGLLGPVVVNAKIIVQRLWEEKLEWDESIPVDLHTAWTDFTSNLARLNEVRIPRFIGTTKSGQQELHGFADASETAYGACVYLRHRDEHGRITSHLICAKTRVAPLKRITIPRLELCAAHLLAQLVNGVAGILNIQPDNIYCYSDSTITLSWIQSPSRKWKTFVSNRVGEIQTLTNMSQWIHVSTRENPADLCSRGISAQEIVSNDLWWHGPSWLLHSNISSRLQSMNVSDRVPETIALLLKSDNNQCTDLIDYERYSTWTKLVRIVALCRKFISILRKSTSDSLVPKASELAEAINDIIRNVQQQQFHDEIESLRTGKEIEGSSPTKSLSPFLDDEQILRVGGRLREAALPYAMKHPILLPRKHYVSTLIVQDAHQRNMHAGQSLTLAITREAYWIIGGKSLVRNVIRHCIRCYRFNPRTHQPLMANLPRNRISAKAPFSEVGIDYAGPFLIKDGQQRSKKTIKAYVVVYVCFTTKAIHLELACDLTTQSFIASLRRFISRRGRPSLITSDNATNFQGAKKEIKELYDLHNSESLQRIEQAMAAEGIEWSYIPPRSPNFGGLWEAGVKAFKTLFKKIVSDTRLTYEEMLTVINQIESILNSRPLTPISNDPNDYSPLTPNHFLIGDKPAMLFDPDVTHLKSNHLSRWQRVQVLQQFFWKRWQKEYLTLLQRRQKWRESEGSPIKTDAIVLIKEDNLPSHQWRLGRVISLQDSSDGIKRVAVVKTQRGNIVRAVNKLCSLPIE